MSAQWHSLAGTTTQRRLRCSRLNSLAPATLLRTVAQQLALTTAGSGGLLHPLEDRWDIQTATLPAAARQPGRCTATQPACMHAC